MHPTDRKRRIVVVLGMHRSGTSVITRGLQPLGVSLGEQLLPEADDNPKGFWEDADVNALNIDLLAALGHDWHTFAPIRSSELAAAEVKDFKLRALAILRDRLRLTDCFGLKDPRIPRLLGFWQDVFDHLQLNASYVIVCRNPLSVARSLAKRNGFELEKGYYLWLEHVRESLVETEKQSRIVVDYDLFLDDPAIQLRRIAQVLELNFDPGNSNLAEFLAGFVESSLRHNLYRIEDLPLDQALPPAVVELYKATLALASDTLAFDDAGFKSLLERLTAEACDLYPALLYMQKCEERAISANCERDQRTAALNHALAAQKAEIARLNQEVFNLGAQLSAVHGSRAWKFVCSVRSLVAPFRVQQSAQAQEIQPE